MTSDTELLLFSACAENGSTQNCKYLSNMADTPYLISAAFSTFNNPQIDDVEYDCVEIVQRHTCRCTIYEVKKVFQARRMSRHMCWCLHVYLNVRKPKELNYRICQVIISTPNQFLNNLYKTIIVSTSITYRTCMTLYLRPFGWLPWCLTKSILWASEESAKPILFLAATSLQGDLHREPCKAWLTRMSHQTGRRLELINLSCLMCRAQWRQKVAASRKQETPQEIPRETPQETPQQWGGHVSCIESKPRHEVQRHIRPFNVNLRWLNAPRSTISEHVRRHVTQ